MSQPGGNTEHAVQEAAYFIWKREGCPEGRALDHWQRAIGELPGEAPDWANGSPDWADEAMDDEEKVVAGRLDANMPALLTRDVPGG